MGLSVTASQWDFYAVLPLCAQQGTHLKRRVWAQRVLAVTLLTGTLHAQQDVTFDAIGLERGLSQSTAQCVLMDSRGLLWVGTQAGLNLYDGAHVSIFRCDPADSTSLSNDDVISLCEDSTGAIWVGTRYGLNRFDTRTASFRRFLCESDHRGGLPHNHVGALAAGSVLWVGTRGGVARLDPTTGQWLPLPAADARDSALTGDAITALCVRGDTVWAGTSTRRLFAVDHSGRVVACRAMPESSPPHQAGLHTFALFVDSRHRLLAAERASGVFVIDASAEALAPLDETVNQIIREREFLVTCITEDAGGSLWIGTHGGGLLRLRGDGISHYDTGLGGCGPPSNHYSSLCPHSSGMLFAGSMDHGVITVRPDRFARLVPGCGPHESLSGPVVTALCEGREGVLWVGLMDGIDRVDLATGRVTTIRQVKGEGGVLNLANVYFLHEDERGLLAGGYPLGLVRLAPDLQTYRRITTSRMVGGAAWSETGELWIAALNEGVWRLDPTSGAERHYLHDAVSGLDLRGRMVFEVLPAGGDLWIGTSDGLFRFNPEAQTTTGYAADSLGGLPDPEILCLLRCERS
ncbi:MAG: hypothetical protein MUE60_07275, partial [Candidatus Eisenbacteria bacterium]|nr:hypothetical protein [Candidatus Eisenbacteria bacterium]